MSTQKPRPWGHNCPRCGAPIVVGQQQCNVCNLPLGQASLNAFYIYQQRQAEEAGMARRNPPRQTNKAAIGASSYLVAVLCVVALIIGVGFAMAPGSKGATSNGSTGGSTGGSKPAATSRPANAGESPVTLSGNGMSNSGQFSLNGGNYGVQWTATDTGGSSVGCFHGGFIERVDGTYAEPIANQMVDGSATGSTHLYGVKSGRYYLKMSSGCKWQVTISPE